MAGNLRAAAGSNAIILASLLAGCTSINATNATFEGTQWQVTAIDGRPTPRTEIYRVRFSDGQFGGQMGCNNFGGSYRVMGNVLALGPITSTEMACSGPGGTFEQWGFAVLRLPLRLTWRSANRLTLSNSAGSIVLERVKVSP